MEPRSGYVETPDVRLHYVDWGGDGPPLLLIHATGFHARLWDFYAERLRDRFRVIAMDKRGHGDSGLPRNGFAWDHFAEDTAALIDALGIEGCAAGGHSAGGTAAAVCAGRVPDSISRLVLIDPVLMDERRQGFPPGGPNPMAERTRRRRAVWDSPHQFEEAMRSRSAFSRWHPDFISAYTHHGLRRRPDGHYELKCAPDVEAQVYEGSLHHNPWPAIEHLTIPSLLLRATLSESGRIGLPADTATRIPNCRDVPVAATHFVPMEEPEMVLREMEQFLLRDA